MSKDLLIFLNYKKRFFAALRMKKRKNDYKRVQSGVDICDVRFADRYEKGKERLYTVQEKFVEKRI